MDRMVFDKLNYGLYVVGVFEGGRNYGCLISSFFQITSGSPQSALSYSTGITVPAKRC